MVFFAEEEAERDCDGVAEPTALAVPAALPVIDGEGVAEVVVEREGVAVGNGEGGGAAEGDAHIK